MSEKRTPLPVENCRRWFKFLCPQEWSQMARTGRFDVRYCPGCRKDVYYCDSLEAVEEHRAAGHCICVEVGVEADGEEPDEWIG